MSALQAAVHRRDARVRARGDVARRKSFEPAQEDRLPIRLLEGEDRIHDDAQRLGARVGARHRFGTLERVLALAIRPSRFGATTLERETLRDAPQPTADAFVLGGRRAERAQPRLLHDVVGRVLVESQRACQRAQRSRVRRDEVGREREVRVHVGAIHSRSHTPARVESDASASEKIKLRHGAASA